MAFRHAKVSSKPDGTDNTLVQPSDWNADHVVTGQTAGDLLYFDGTEWTRLAVGADGRILTVSSGSPSWQPAPQELPSNPQAGDLVYYNGSQWMRLGIGSNGQLLTVSGGAPSWQNAPSGGGFPSNPQTGDLVYYDGSAWVRLAAGANGRQLTVINGSPAWADDFMSLIPEAPWLPSPASSWRCLFPFVGTGGTLALTAGRCYFIPFQVMRPRALTDLGIEVSTASAGTAEVAIYNADGTSTRPGTRVAYVSGLDTGTTGVKSGAVSLTLQPGMYWAALRATAAATLRATANPFSWAIVTGGNNRATHLYNTDTSLANPVASDPTTLGVGTVPHIYARWS